MKKEHWLITYSRQVNAEIKSDEIYFVKDPVENALLNDIENYPHAFVLACCMDRQVNAERAWRIPCIIRNLCNEFSVQELASLPLEWYERVFAENALHRYNEKMSKVFYNAVQRLHLQYHDDASAIWAGCPSSAAVVYRFLQFDGVGVKIATMATNTLARQFGIPFSDYSSIDVSPDVQVLRVFSRVGLTDRSDTREAVIYRARELCPEYPGIVDAACWRIGREHCFPSSPDCEHCPVNERCPKLL